MGRLCMRYRAFGRTGWQTSEIGFGTWGMGGWTGSDDEESRRAIDRALALGCNFFDTAWVYGQGKSEQLLGQALRLARPELVDQPPRFALRRSAVALAKAEGRARSGQAPTQQPRVYVATKI